MRFPTTHLLVVFDGFHSSAPRKKLYPDYKAQRLPPSQSLSSQIQLIKELCILANYPFLCIAQHEADDVIASVVHTFCNQEKKKFTSFSSTEISSQLPLKSSTEKAGYIDSFTINHPEILYIDVVTSDKDLVPLLQYTRGSSGESYPKVSILQPHKHFRTLTVDIVQKEWGLQPNQVPDFLAMVGDSTDNIPGIPSIGPKTALKLLEKYKSLQ
ncbi:5'-3' exonuclease, N-terminal resolvase family domain-containing protein, partial [Cardiosporidium cionae]